jgi:hypothetical protein
VQERIAEADEGLRCRARLSVPKPIALGELQTLLADNEALILLLDVPQFGGLEEETLVWAITRTQVNSVRVSRGTSTLAEDVAALRCGLDQTAWDGEGAAYCSNLLKGAHTLEDMAAGKPLPFDLARAHELYQALFGQARDLIKNKHLLIVPSGPLTALPFQVLVTDRPARAVPTEPEGYRDVAWLTKSHAITVLPSVASLKALREFAKGRKLLEVRGNAGIDSVELSVERGDPRAHVCGALPVSTRYVSVEATHLALTLGHHILPLAYQSCEFTFTLRKAHRRLHHGVGGAGLERPLRKLEALLAPSIVGGRSVRRAGMRPEIPRVPGELRCSEPDAVNTLLRPTSNQGGLSTTT